MKSETDIEFSGKKRTDCITIWISEDEKELYRLLKVEYDVDIAKEMRKAIAARLIYLRENVIGPKRAG